MGYPIRNSARSGAAILAIVLSGCASLAIAPSISAAPVEASSVAAAPEQVWFFPDIDWSAYTDGGRGGEIVRVTNLNNDGPGSLREAIAMEGPRIVVFEVGGVIDLEKQTITISNPDITIAGQTAPSPGITLIRGGIDVKTHDVILQHLRIHAIHEQLQPVRHGIHGVLLGQGLDFTLHWRICPREEASMSIGESLVIDVVVIVGGKLTLDILAVDEACFTDSGEQQHFR